MFRTLLAATALFLTTAPAMAELVNLRQSCDRWEYYPANEAFGTRETALLFCSVDEGRPWMALRIECHPDARGAMKVRFQPMSGYRPSAPIVQSASDAAPQTASDIDPVELTPELAALEIDKDAELGIGAASGPREMIFFSFGGVGHTVVSEYDAGAQDWVFFEREPLSTVFRSLISGNYVDIKLFAVETIERFPLRGSGKALTPLVESCRIAKRDAEKADQ